MASITDEYMGISQLLGAVPLLPPKVYAYVNMRSSMNHVHCSNPHHPSSVATALASLGSPASSPITS